MSDNYEKWIIIIGSILLVLFLTWMNPWLLLIIPVTILAMMAFDDSAVVSRDKEIAELKFQIEKKDESIESIQEELSDARKFNRQLKHELAQLYRELESIKNPDAEIRQAELDAEREITGGA